jgi:hypothetical protein
MRAKKKRITTSNQAVKQVENRQQDSNMMRDCDDGLSPKVVFKKKNKQTVDSDSD